MKNPTPRPWINGHPNSGIKSQNAQIWTPDKFMVLDSEYLSDQDAAHIVKCVNMHDDLCQLLKDIQFTIENGGNDSLLDEVVEKIVETLARAK